VVPRAGLEAVVKRKISSPCRDSNPRSPKRYTTELFRLLNNNNNNNNNNNRLWWLIMLFWTKYKSGKVALRSNLEYTFVRRITMLLHHWAFSFTAVYRPAVS
jgi:hypothetical protein